MTVHVTVTPPSSDTTGKKKLSFAVMAMVFVAILFFTAAAFAMAYGVLSGDTSFLQTVAETFLELSKRLLEALAKK